MRVTPKFTFLRDASMRSIDGNAGGIKPRLPLNAAGFVADKTQTGTLSHGRASLLRLIALYAVMDMSCSSVTS